MDPAFRILSVTDSFRLADPYFLKGKSGFTARSSLKGTLAWDLFVPVFCTDQTYIGQIIRLLSVFDFVLEFADLFDFFYTFGGDSVDAESHSPSTESTPSETPCRLSQHRVRFHVNWVNAEWWNLRECWCLLRWLSWRGVSSALTQLTWSLTPRWLSWRGVSLRVDSVCGREIKLKQVYIPSSGAFKGIVYRKIIHEIVKWGQYQL